MPLTREMLLHEMEATLDRIGVGMNDWPERVDVATLSPRGQLVALLLVMDVSPRRVNGWRFRSAEDDIVRFLPRKTLPWDSDTAVFALQAALKVDCMNYICGPALRGAEKAMADGYVDTALYEALDACAIHLAGLMHGRIATRWNVDKDLKTANRLLASFLPPGVLDLTAVHDGDEWAERARQLARAHPVDDVEPLIRHLAVLGHKTPSQTWQRQLQEVLRPDAARALVGEWVRAARETEVAEDGHLYAPSNEDLVRAAVIAARSMDVTEVPAAVLGALVRQGAETRPPSTESLALRVASAAVDTLAQRSADGDLAELEALLDDISRRDLLKRIGAALGPEAVARAGKRDAELKKEKAAAVRAKASPIPKLLRGEVDRMLEEHVNGTMRELGFRKSGRTWRRWVDARVEVIDFYSSDLYMSVQYGVLFEGLHPEGGPATQRDPKRVKPFELDLLVSDTGWFADDDVLDLLAERVRTEIIPFLQRCGDRTALFELLLHGVGLPPVVDRGDPRFRDTDYSVSLRRRPAQSGVLLGALACIDGDRAAAESWLGAADRQVDPLSHHATKSEIDYWRTRVAALPAS
ncbi:DUF4304 domain-containing protein [Microbacterium maritypicum]|uniref:DUF4304 domain-containing protein n=1 Tax=Microbacterium maritypicum TaxID=33918 RepID=UPI003823FA34